MNHPPLVRPPGQRRRALHDPVAAIIADMANKHGKCWATEQGLRRELARRTGYVCGERSIGRIIHRAKARGEWGQQRVKPGRKMVTGVRTSHGTQHTWIVSRFEQRKARRAAAEEKRQRLRREGKERARLEQERLEAEQREREDLGPRIRDRQVSVGVLAPMPKLSDLIAPPPPDDSSSFEEIAERRRQEVARQLAELARLGFVAPDKPPDK